MREHFDDHTVSFILAGSREAPQGIDAFTQRGPFQIERLLITSPTPSHASSDREAIHVRRSLRRSKGAQTVSWMTLACS